MITSLLPAVPGPLTGADLRERYAYPDPARPFVRFNFVTAADVAATAAGRSAGLGNDGDKLIFGILRELADVVLVGAGTIRAEGYQGELVDAATRARRRDAGLQEHPALGIISGSLDLDPAGGLFTASPVRPVIFTTSGADAGLRRELEAVADVVACGPLTVAPAEVVRSLFARGLTRVLCEGGPAVLGSFTAAGVLDDLCLSTSPLLVGGDGPRISSGTSPDHPVALRLVSLLHEESALYARYLRH